ncbi:hypothetical protein [Halobacterium sp. R2-5]|uniref:hypothetical protein n=1 Tax=Halobacterium sp. R2-5 TaxID=2715751 RepID=UPI0014217EA2|nr:hypothetical protein [Halobacterium sp. R2-5]NIC00258.1 hypothetical protein [Halobacterium sp. R2-5]
MVIPTNRFEQTRPARGVARLPRLAGAAEQSVSLGRGVTEMAQKQGLADLADLSGSGDNVLVKAQVTCEQDLDSHRPYQKGLLWDKSMNYGDIRAFVVYDPDVRLEPGKVYVLNGKDHYYDPRGEVQLMLHDGAYVKELYDTNS